MNQANETLTLSQIAALLETTPQILRQKLSLLPEEIQRWRPASGEWCINEVLGHLIEADRNGFDGRIRTILAEERPHLIAWDIGGVSARRRDCERNGLDLLAELAVMRAQSAQLVAALQPEQLARTGLHPVVGELAVSDLLHEWAYHDYNHVRQILSNVQAFIWPSLKNAQKFSK